MSPAPTAKAPEDWYGLTKIKDTDRCPYCGSKDTDWYDTEQEDDGRFQGADWIEDHVIMCNGCGNCYHEVNMCAYVGFATYAEPSLLPKTAAKPKLKRR